MSKVYTLINNNKNFEISLTRKRLNMIPYDKNDVYDELNDNKIYQVQNQVSDNTFQSFLDYWGKNEHPQITANNYYEFYLLNNEFGLLNEIINQPQYKIFNDLTILINSFNDIDIDRSSIEKKVSQNFFELLFKKFCKQFETTSDQFSLQHFQSSR